MLTRTMLPVLVGMLCLAPIAGWLPLGSSPRTLDELPPALTLQQVVLSPVADAYLDLAQLAGNYGLATTLDVVHFSATTRRALLRFNIAEALPRQAVIDSAVLELYLQNSEHGNVLDLYAGLLSQDWEESQVNWRNQPAYREPIVTCSLDPTPGVYKQLDITAIVRAWHNAPHYGLRLWGPEDTMLYGFWFQSREQETNHPRLIVQYHIPSPTPSSTWSPEPAPSATPTPTPSATMPPDCPDLLLNGDFETGSLPPWQAGGPAWISWGRASPYGAWLGGQNGAVAQLDQTVSIPAGANPVWLDFWWLAACRRSGLSGCTNAW